MPKDQNPHDSGSFLTGLGLGLLGGAVGYFLFATEKGDKVRKKLAEEFEEIQKMTQSTAPTRVETSTGSLKSMVFSFLDQMIEQSRLEQSAAVEDAKNKKKKTKKKLFRGVG